ncbi:MAG: hypothetical protein ACPG31_10185 [Planctomycetota bacterium]
MEGGPLTTPEFKAFTANVVPYLNITTHIEGRAHEDLLKEVGGRGFPTLKYMDGDGNVLGEPSGRDVASFQSTLTAIEGVFAIEKRIEAGEEGLEVELFLAKLDMGAYKYEAAKKKVASFEKLTEEQKKMIAAKMVNLEVNHLVSNLSSEEGVPAVAARFKEMLESGQTPTGDAENMFWNILMYQAEIEKDAVLMKKGIDALRRIYADMEDVQTQLNDLEKKVDNWETEAVDS